MRDEVNYYAQLMCGSQAENGPLAGYLRQINAKDSLNSDYWGNYWLQHHMQLAEMFQVASQVLDE